MYKWGTYNNAPPIKQCVECGRQYTQTGEMLLKPVNKSVLRKLRLKLDGTYDGCVFP